MIAGCLAFLLWIPTSSAQVLLDVTQTGAELAANPEIVFHQPPTIDGDAAVFTSVGERFLFEWPLLSAGARSTTVVEITVDFTPLTADSDSTWGLHDGSNVVGYMRVDNSSGALFSREGTVSGIDLPTPPQLTSAPTGLDPVDPFTMAFFMPGGGGPTVFEFMEDLARHTDEFVNNPIDGSGNVVLYFGGGNDPGESYRINSLRVQVRGMEESSSPLAYFPLANCGVVNTERSNDGKLSDNETRRFIVRGETTDLSVQGGSATGCDVPQNAEAIVANFWVFNFNGNGSLRVGASGKSLGASEGTLIRYNGSAVFNQTNATVLDLCDNDTCTSDFQVNVKGTGSAANLLVSVMGYFAPIEEIEQTTIDTTTEALTVTGPGGVSIEGGDLVQAPGTPVRVGSVATSLTSPATAVSGRYVYSVGRNDTFTIIDVLNPAAPATVSTLNLPGEPTSIFVAEPYAYVALAAAEELKILDISDPTAPVEIGSTQVPSPKSVVVSGQYAYLVGGGTLSVVVITDPTNPYTADTEILPPGSAPDAGEVTVSRGHLYVVSDALLSIYSLNGDGTPILRSSTDLPDLGSRVFVAEGFAYILSGGGLVFSVFDVSDPTAPVPGPELAVQGGSFLDVFVAGRYAFFGSTEYLQFIDVDDPQDPVIFPEGILSIGKAVHSLTISGRFVYLQTPTSLEIVDLIHGELGALVAHSLEAGQLRVQNDVVTQGDLQVAGGLNVGSAGIFSEGPVGFGESLTLAKVSGDVPFDPGLVSLYAQDDGAGVELRVRDGSGNVTILSPHNFSLIGEPSEPLAWSYFSENEQGKINVDMLRVVRLLEELTGETLVFLDPVDGSGVGETAEPSQSLLQQLHELRLQNQQLEKDLEEIRSRLGLR